MSSLSAAKVTVIRTATNTVGRPITLPTAPAGIVMAPGGKTAYAVSPGSATVGQGRLTPIQIATSTAGRPILVGQRPFSMAITPNGKTAYVVNERSETVTPVQTATRKVEKAIKVGLVPSGIVITPNGQTAYVANLNSVTPIHLATGKPATRIMINGFPPIIVALALAGRVPGAYAAFGLIAATMIVALHRDNIQRLRDGTEPKFGKGGQRRSGPDAANSRP